MKGRKLLSLVLAFGMILSMASMSASASKVNPDPADDGASVIYTVAKGDSLWKIAARNDLTLAELVALNPQIKNPGMIYVGDKVVVARHGAPVQPEIPVEPKPEVPVDPQPETPAVQSADLVLKNGVIQTMVNESDVKQAVAVRGNEIVYVGDDAGVAAYVGANTNVIDLKGQFVSPGFMDGHLHAPGAWMSRLYEINLEGLKTNEEYLTVVKTFVTANPELDAYYGGTFMLNAYQKADGSNPGPQKEDLDAICSDKPIIISDVSHHSIWVNSKALEMAGITKDTPDPQGGIIMKNAKGEPSGYLTDGAMYLVTDKVPPVEYTEEMIRTAMENFLEEANSFGVTAITDMNGSDAGHVKVLQSMDADDALTVRFRPAYMVPPGASKEETVKAIQDLEKTNTDMVKWGSLKVFYDGVTEGATAVMLNPYQPEAGKGDGWYGEAVWTDLEFDAMVLAADKAGIQVHVHTIGDGAVRETLNAFEDARKQNGTRDSRHIITHVSAISDQDIPRLADLGVVSALQFLWMYADPLYELEAAFIGTERANAMYPTKKMLEAGCMIAGASDNPVTAYDVLDEIEVGVTRNSPYDGEDTTDMYRWADQALTPYQMLEIYTKNVAYENFMEQELGTIEVGKKADLVVLSQNILKCEPKTISDTAVVYTISDGSVVYTAK